MSFSKIESISCGQGAPSLFLIVLAGEGYFHADVVVVADTGWETDMLWSTGKRTDSKIFFENITKPLSESFGIQAVFVRSKRKDGTEYPPIPDMQHPGKEDIPLFGSEGGRLRQTCTSKWKIQAIRQELRRQGAKSAITYLGLTLDEVHRIKPNNVKWEQLSWPLIGYPIRDNWTKKFRRFEINKELMKRNIPFLITSQCDGCPHKDYFRWKNNSQEKITELAKFERRWEGKQFLTSCRKPLPEALIEMENQVTKNNTLDFCENGYCFQ
ncbi:hypothetical protein KJ742_03180 [Patescibacteria group bacterium]|nr:hypothetical protein [Patescibacteria group bacterium]